MEKEIRKEIVKEEVTHKFYCDGCNTFLDEVQEYDDGYYPQIGRFELKVHLPDGWYIVKRTYCDQCRVRYVEELRSVLCNMGFEKER